MDDYGDTNGTYDSWDEEEYDVSHEPWRIIFAVLYSMILVLGLPGHIAVVAVISSKRHLCSITNMYLLNRSIAEILGMVFLPISLAGLFMGNQFLKYPYCLITAFIGFFSPLCNWVFLVLLAVDCYLATRPQHHTLQYRWKMLKIGCAVTWAAAVPLAALAFVIPYYLLRNNICHVHILFLPDEIFYFTSDFIQTIVPVLVLWVYISFIYTGKTGPNTAASDGEGSISSLKRFILVLAIFNTVCCTPAWLGGTLARQGFISFNALLIVYYIAYLPSIVDPVLYFTLRKDLKQTLTNCCSSRSTELLPLNTV